MGDATGSKGEAKPEAPRAPPALTDHTAEFDEYTSPRVDAQGRPMAPPRGLNAAGYRFPPPAGPAPPLTKANLAKGIGVPEVPRAKPGPGPAWPVPPLPGAQAPPAAPPAPKPTAVKVDEGDLFEEYHRPDLKDNPRTGKGLRVDPPRVPEPTAKDILSKIPEPELQVFTPRRFSPYQVRPAEPAETGVTEAAEKAAHLERERAALDAAADVAAHRAWLDSATMSRPAQGPIKAIIHDGHAEPVAIQPEPPMPTPAEAVPDSPTPWTPPRSPTPYMPPQTRASAPDQTPGVVTAYAHRPDAPAATPGGDLPRIALVQADFNFDITNRMAQAALERAAALGAEVAHHVHVPGAFDIPLTAQALLRRDDIDAVVCVGAVIQGETGHDVLVATECARKLADLALATGKPVGFGVAGPRVTREQAWARVSMGAAAVESAVKQHRVLRQVRA